MPSVVAQEIYAKVGFTSSTSVDSHVFRAISGSGRKAKLRAKNEPISYSRIRELFKEALRKLGYNDSLYGLHSMRIGGATSAAKAGIGHALLKSHGRWKSDVAKDLYIRFSEDEVRNVSRATGI